MLSEPLADGIVGRARAAGLVEIHVHDLRDHTDDRHRSVDDAPFGGGPGMVMKAEPFARALAAIRAEAGSPNSQHVRGAAGSRRAALAARAALRPADRAPLRRPRTAGAAVRALRGHRRARGAVARDRGAEPRGFRADGRRDGGTRGGRGQRAPAAGCPRGRGFGGRRFVRGGSPRLAALHAPRRVARRARAGSAAVGRPRAHPRLAPARVAADDARAAAGALRRGEPHARGPSARQGDRGRGTGRAGPGRFTKTPPSFTNRDGRRP